MTAVVVGDVELGDVAVESGVLTQLLWGIIGMDDGAVSAVAEGAGAV